MPLLMGVVNVTPDSFSDGGAHDAPDEAVAHGLALLDEGADWLDIGGMSTRPGSKPVPPAEEAERVVPVLRGLSRARPEVPLSVDTSRASVARAALDAGATIVNDVSALADPDMPLLCAEREASVVLMHLRGAPETMQADTVYDDLVSEVEAFLLRRVGLALAAGIRADRILLDPGLGFGKALLDNPRLVQAVPRLAALGYPVLVGASRKQFIGALTGVRVARERVHGSVGAALAAAHAGAAVLRVHDVAATRQALQVFWACRVPE